MNNREYYLDWPKEVSIETFAKCNAACTFCPYTTLDRIGTKMPDELIERIIDELKDHPWPFIVSPWTITMTAPALRAALAAASIRFGGT